MKRSKKKASVRVKQLSTPVGDYCKCIEFHGYFDLYNTDEVYEVIYKEISCARKETHFIFHLEKVQHASSQYFAMLVECGRILQRMKSKLTLTHATKNVLNLIDRLGLNAFFEYHPTLQEALRN